MEDAHAAVLDLKPEGDDKTPTERQKRLSFFGVYDGHGGDKVAIYTGENLHKIVAKQDAFKEGNIEQALKDGFLATDRAILSGMKPHETPLFSLTCFRADVEIESRPQIRRRSIWLHSLGRHNLARQNLLRRYPSSKAK